LTHHQGKQRAELIRSSKALDRSDLFADDRSYRRDTRPASVALNENGARAALTLSASILGARQIELLAEHTQQARLPIGVDRVNRLIYFSLSYIRHPEGSFAESFIPGDWWRFPAEMSPRLVNTRCSRTRKVPTNLDESRATGAQWQSESCTGSLELSTNLT
jgi:hypothetical protein